MAPCSARSDPAPERLQLLGREGVRLFFVLGAGYAIVMPLAWLALFSLQLPLATRTPVTQWHAYEMIFGVFGASLAGFLSSAVPEWTDTPRLHGRALWRLALLWLPGRIAGLLGADAALALVTATDAAFLGTLLVIVVRPMIAKRITRHAMVGFWTAVLLATLLAARWGWLAADYEVSALALHSALAVFAILMALAMSRVNVVVVNLALDPSGQSTPYRPHPGRQNLAAAMVAAYAAAHAAAPGSAVGAWLALAAAAAFFDRLAEWFIGRAVLRAEVLALATANTLAGLAFAAIGAAGLGAPLAASTGVHLLAVGALGMATLAIFSIAGLRHTGHALRLGALAKAAFVLVLLAAAVRTLPLVLGWSWAGLASYTAAALLWSAAFGVWLLGYWPVLSGPQATKALPSAN